MDEKKHYQHCAGPGCTNMVEQMITGRGHRKRLYCHKNCRMAAVRARQRAAEAEAERQRLLALEMSEKAEIHNRFPKLAKGSIDLLYQLKKQHGLSIVSLVGTALYRERELGERVAPPEPKDVLQANCISWGHTLNFPAVNEQGIDIPEGLGGWWHYTNYTPEPVLKLFYSIVQRLYQEKRAASKASA